jgi:hypothetical protein
LKPEVGEAVVESTYIFLDASFNGCGDVADMTRHSERRKKLLEVIGVEEIIRLEPARC